MHWRFSSPVSASLVLKLSASQGRPVRYGTATTTAPDARNVSVGCNPHRERPHNLDGLAKNLRKHDDGRYHWHWDPAFIERRHDDAEGLHDPELLDRAARSLTLPTLLVRGRLSDLLSQEGADAFLEQVPHAKFADVSGAGHMVAGDQNDIFADAVLNFLGSEL